MAYTHSLRLLVCLLLLLVVVLFFEATVQQKEERCTSAYAACTPEMEYDPDSCIYLSTYHACLKGLGCPDLKSLIDHDLGHLEVLASLIKCDLHVPR